MGGVTGTNKSNDRGLRIVQKGKTLDFVANTNLDLSHKILENEKSFISNWDMIFLKATKFEIKQLG